jgi:tetratricopeptide repeat protein 30
VTLQAGKHTEALRKLAKNIENARHARDNDALKVVLHEYDEALERYIPVLMAQAKIYWDIENYEMCEKIFKQSSEFASGHDTWKLNVAHVFFMQVRSATLCDAISCCAWARAQISLYYIILCAM